MQAKCKVRDERDKKAALHRMHSLPTYINISFGSVSGFILRILPVPKHCSYYTENTLHTSTLPVESNQDFCCNDYNSYFSWASEALILYYILWILFKFTSPSTSPNS